MEIWENAVTQPLTNDTHYLTLVNELWGKYCLEKIEVIIL